MKHTALLSVCQLNYARYSSLSKSTYGHVLINKWSVDISGFFFFIHSGFFWASVWNPKSQTPLLPLLPLWNLIPRNLSSLSSPSLDSNAWLVGFAFCASVDCKYRQNTLQGGQLEAKSTSVGVRCSCQRGWHLHHAGRSPESPLDNHRGCLPSRCKQAHVGEEAVGGVVIGKACKVWCSAG